MNNELNNLIFKNLNDEQIEFVKSSNHNVLISASAGTGKTTTMIRKLLYLLVVEKLPIKNLLVVTFTNAAANEMRQKLYNVITEVVSAIDDEELLHKLYEDLENINDADIGTMHAICKKWISKYFYALDLDPSFSIVTDKDKAYLFETAMQQVVNNYIKLKDEGFFRLYSSYNDDRKIENIKILIRSIYQFLESKINKEDWEKRTVNECYNCDLDKNSCAEFLVKYYKNEYDKQLIVFQNILNQFSFSNQPKIIESLKIRIAFLEYVKSSKNVTEFLLNQKDYEIPRRPNIPKDLVPELLDTFDNFKLCNDEFLKLKTEVGNTFQNFNLDIVKFQIEDISKNVKKLFEVVELVGKYYAKLKADKALLDFNDLEHKTIELFKNEEIVSELKNQYKFIFFDEYQDVNEIQEYILNQISGSHNINLIGDVKQSIYEFRLSMPQNFVDKFNQFSSDCENCNVINFNKNYRSDNNILQFSNKIFDKLITKQTLGIDYISNSRLISGLNTNTNNCVVNINIVNSVNEEEKANNVDSVKAQSLLVCEHIKNLLNSSYLDSAGCKHNFEFKDIAILSRNKKENIKILFETLKEFNIPAKASFKNELFSTWEVMLLINVLKLLNDKYNDIALVSLLKSCVFNLVEEDLVQITLSSNLDSFCDKFYCYDGENAKIQYALKSFNLIIEKYRGYLKNHTIIEVIEKFVAEYDLLSYFKSLSDGLEKESNVEEFFSLISNENFGNDIQKLLDYILEIENKDYSLTVSSMDNSVSIMTIHTSKGLGIKSVILFDIGRNFNLNMEKRNITISNNLGIGLKYLDYENRLGSSSICNIACGLDKVSSELNEEIRLFYVALTRAEKDLFIVGACDLQKKTTKKIREIADCKNYLDFIFYSLGDLDYQNFYNEKNEFFIFDNMSSAFVEIFQFENLIKDFFTKPDIYIGNPDMQTVAKLQDFYKYKADNLSNKIALKNSVTSILKEDVDYENICEDFTGVNLENNIVNYDSLKYGTIMHSIMEQINFNENAEQVNKIIDDYFDKNSKYIEYKNLIPISQIINAISTISSIMQSGTTIRKEIQFMMKVPYADIVDNSDEFEQILVQGVIDLVLENGDDAIIIDYKTNKTTNEYYLKEHYQKQLNLYSKAYENAYKKHISAKYIYLFENNTLIKV